MTRPPFGTWSWEKDIPKQAKTQLCAYARWVVYDMPGYMAKRGISQHGEVLDVVVVGSYVHGRADELSDLDVILVLEGCDVFRCANKDTLRRTWSFVTSAMPRYYVTWNERPLAISVQRVAIHDVYEYRSPLGISLLSGKVFNTQKDIKECLLATNIR